MFVAFSLFRNRSSRSLSAPSTHDVAAGVVSASLLHPFHVKDVIGGNDERILFCAFSKTGIFCSSRDRERHSVDDLIDFVCILRALLWRLTFLKDSFQFGARSCPKFSGTRCV